MVGGCTRLRELISSGGTRKRSSDPGGTRKRSSRSAPESPLGEGLVPGATDGDVGGVAGAGDTAGPPPWGNAEPPTVITIPPVNSRLMKTPAQQSRCQQ